MTLDPSSLTGDLDLLERIEKATLRFVVQAIWDFPEAPPRTLSHSHPLGS